MTQNNAEMDRAARFRALSQTAADTFGGKLLRRFWHPVALSEKLPRGAAQPLHILGEELTLYRGESGRAYVVAGRCAHRRTMLHAGWVQGEQIRCIYHGWRYDGRGQCTHRPAEKDTGMPAVKITAYPVREYCGLVFAYLGPAPAPEFDLPRKEAFEHGGAVFARAERWPCNWFQMIENSLDPTHLSFVHKMGQPSYLGGIPEELPQLSAEETEFGLELLNIRSNGHDLPRDPRTTAYLGTAPWLMDS